VAGSSKAVADSEPWCAPTGPLDATGITLETEDGDAAKQWYTVVANYPIPPKTLRVFAICAKDRKARIESEMLTVPAGQTTETTVECPGSKRALGGGIVQSGAANFTVRSSGPLDRSGITLNTTDGDVAKQWSVAVENGSSGERVLKIFAICAKDSKARIAATEFTAAPSTTTEATVACPGAKRAVGGGVVQSGSPSGLYMSASSPLDRTGITLQTDDGDVAKQWYAAIDNQSEDQRVVKVFAICV
jgi:hypothetical protein